MKTLTLLYTLLSLAVANQASAAIESIKIDPVVTPLMPAALQQSGAIDARVVVVVNVSDEGKLTDNLVIGYTHRELVQPVTEALKSWHFQPARQDGVAVPAQVTLTITFDREGSVVSYIGLDLINSYVERITGTKLEYRPSRTQELDRAPVRINTVSPKYALEALKQGVRGKVQVHFYIDETGKVRMPAVESSNHPYLAEIAVAAVKEWTFEPVTSRGTPVLIEAQQEFTFGDT